MGDEKAARQLKPEVSTGLSPSPTDIGMLTFVYTLFALGEPIPWIPCSIRHYVGTSEHAPKPVENEDPVKPLGD